METIEKNIINDYFLLLEKLSSAGKLELIERLVKSIKREKSSEGPTDEILKTEPENLTKEERKKLFEAACGSWESEKIFRRNHQGN